MAVSYVIAIMLGIVVLGLVGYWLFSAGGGFSGQSFAAECNSKKLIFCQGGGWDTGCGTPPSQTECNQILGISSGSAGDSASGGGTSGPEIVHKEDFEPPEPPKKG